MIFESASKYCPNYIMDHGLSELQLLIVGAKHAIHLNLSAVLQ